MRVLFSTLPATGHFNSLLPLAEAVADAGHDVAVCCTPAFAEQVAAAGFEHLPGGAETFGELFVDAPPRSDPDRLSWAHRVAFATRAVEAMLPDLERHAREWRADIIVRETAEFAGCLVAERLGASAPADHGVKPPITSSRGARIVSGRTSIEELHAMTDGPVPPPTEPTPAPAAPAPAAPPPEVPTAEDDEATPWWGRPWVLITAAVVLGLIVIGVLTSGGDDDGVASASDSPAPSVSVAGSAEPSAAPSEAPSAAAPTVEPTPSAEPTPELATFGPGTVVVGEDVEPGTYRGEGDTLCYWERLSGFSGELDDVITNDLGNVHPIVTIADSDAGFNSEDCGSWTADLSAITDDPAADFGDGTYQVGVDISPGTWRAAGGDTCFWERLSGFSGELDDVIANDLGPTDPVVTIDAADVGFGAEGCGDWTFAGG